MTGWLLDHDEEFTLPVLEPISPYFSIPRLIDKPQDPIVQALQLSAVQSPGIPSNNRLLSPSLSQSNVPCDVSKQGSEPPLWDNMSLHQSQDIDRSMSWNPNPPTSNRKSPFLTEQPSSLLGSLQNQYSVNHILQKARHPKSRDARSAEIDLFSSLHLVVLGTSSSLYTWDTHSQSFVQVPDVSDSLVHDGMSRSILQRFLGLGTLVRRLDKLVQELRGRRGHTNTTVHAFAHGLSSVLALIRNRLSCGPLFDASQFSAAPCLATVWAYYSGQEQIVISLASMCSRSIDIPPNKFTVIPTAPVDLLTLVYETFEKHVECHSPRVITAVMAYMLTVSSKPYIHALCRLLAYGEARQLYVTTTEKTQLVDTTFHFEAVEAEDTLRGEEGGIDADGPFPTFIPESLGNILPAAHRSLKLLEAARPEHPIFSAELPSKEISWTWTEESLKSLWNGVDVDDNPIALPSRLGHSSADNSQVGEPTGNPDPLSEFKVFDLEPGSFSSPECDSQVALGELMANFPDMLPHITPIPSLLCEVMFAPLRDHATSLSRALLAVFLDRSSLLCIDAHLELLRSHMMLTSHSFKSRLSAALFSDAEDRTSHSAQMYNLLRYKSKGTTPPDSSHAGRWPVGLAPLLGARDSWPPGGSELSFLLRTVIVDSQQNNPSNVESTDPDVDGALRVMSEAESRLGFALRELSGRGHERWLDPLSIEALDFLYLDYKVPQALQTLIPTAVLSKYQRMFAFLLRLTRVECAIRSVFRLTRVTAAPLFPTLSSSRKLLLHVRFAAHTFLSALSTYIYDTAIRGNFDAFLLHIAACRETPDAPGGFRDIFTLAECHSSVLDDILSACLLRSSQRAAGDLLRGTLEIILEFCVMVGDLKDGRLAEYQAAPVLDALHASFCKKVSTLVRTLEVLLEKQGKSRRLEELHAAYAERETRVPPGGVDSLRHFLTYLNQNDWWVKIR